MRRERDVEAELNLPPGFRFHPTDEELIVQYLCSKVSYQCPPVSIIGEVDIYKYDPWKLPEMALFGTKEWNFFSPRDKKYPNGSRPNKVTRNGYWKATGADKPIRPMGFNKNVGIKKSLVLFSGKAPKGIKTNWIMREYRLAKPNQPSHKKSSLRLDDWVLCRIYNNKNIWDQKEESSIEETMDSFKVVEDTRSDGNRDLKSHTDFYPPRELDEHGVPQSLVGTKTTIMKDEDNNWFMDLNLDDLQDSLTLFGAMPTLDQSYHDSQAPILRILLV